LSEGSTMKCPRCNNQNPADAVFCEECGSHLEAVCPSCGEANRLGAKFCKKCGQRLARPDAAGPEAAPKFGSRETYTPQHLADKILTSRSALEGERKQVTVLFADIKGSTELINNLDPEEARRVLDPALYAMMEAVHRYEGTVNQVLGDGIMALFGAPLAHEDHALRACYASLAMQEEIRRWSEKVGRLRAFVLRIGVGLNSGEVVVRTISNDLNIDYSAIGHTTHLAARMEELAAPGSIMMTATTHREVEGFVHVKALPPAHVKGVTSPVEVFELSGVTSVRKRLHAAAARGLTRFVGRKTEIEIFDELLDQAGAGHGQILAMVGEPGVGKSRLVYEFLHSQLDPSWRILESASVSYGKATAYFPLTELLKGYFNIEEGEKPDAIEAKVERYILKLDEGLFEAVPPFLSLLDALPETHLDNPNAYTRPHNVVEALKKFNDFDLQQRRRNTLEMLKRVLIRESQNQPLILVFEDLHWIDNATQAFLDILVESLPAARILLLVNYRPGYNHAWANKTYYTRLRVDPLPSNGADELLQCLLGDGEDLGPLRELLIKRTQGNPFFLEESVRSLTEIGVLSGEKGAYRLVQATQAIRIPHTVQAVLAGRIDRLPLEEKHLLQTAAVIGVKVIFSLLRAITDLAEEKLHTYLTNLQAAEFLYETNLFPELEYTFKHALTNEVVYGALLHERRTSLHARIVSALEVMAGDNLHNQIEKLAHHAFHAELWDKAVIYLKEAGGKAVSRSCFRDAVLCFEQALESLRHLPETTDTLKHAVDLRVEIRNALFILGDFRQGIKYLEEAKSAAVALNDKGRLGTLFNLMTAHWNLAGNAEHAIASGEEALEHTKGPEHLDLHIVTHYFLGAAYHNLGQFDQAVGVLEQALSLIGDRKHERFGTTGIVSVISRAWLVRCLAQIGRFGEAAAYGDEAIQIAVESDHPYSIVYAYFGVGTLLLMKGDFDKAIPVLQRGLEVCQASEIPVQRPLVASCLGSAYAFAGRLDEGLRLLESAVENTASMSRLGGQALRMAWLSEAYDLAGRTDEAEALARRGLDLSGKSKDRGSQTWLLRVLGDLTARHSPLNVERAEANYGEALALAQELGMRPVQAHCHLGLGQVYDQVKDFSKARSELRTAVELYRAMSMPFWLLKAETALAKTPDNSQR
jgi:class 3 adenylate cyclase/tetratricopeptide (TPR) repeat protein